MRVKTTKEKAIAFPSSKLLLMKSLETKTPSNPSFWGIWLSFLQDMKGKLEDPLLLYQVIKGERYEMWYSSSRLVFVTSSAIWRYDDLSFSALHTIRWDIAVVLLLLFFLVPTVKHKHPNQFWVCSSGFLLSLLHSKKVVVFSQLLSLLLPR